MINNHLHSNDIDFADTHMIKFDVGEDSAYTVYIDMMKATPKWIDDLMGLRNRLVAVAGIKDLGKLSDIKTTNFDEVCIGERIGIFVLEKKHNDKILLSDKDKHLDVYIALKINRELHHITVTTEVKLHNWLGRLYLLLVIPAHKIIVPAALKAYVSSKGS